MRCAEYFLKISYRLRIQKARISKKSTEKEVETQEKRRIQKECHRRMNGIRVDFPNPSGGTTNDGPTCRRLFRNWKVLVLYYVDCYHLQPHQHNRCHCYWHCHHQRWSYMLKTDTRCHRRTGE